MIDVLLLSLALAADPDPGAAPAAEAPAAQVPAAPTPYPPSPAPAAPTPTSPEAAPPPAEQAPTEASGGEKPAPMAGYVPGEGFRLQDESGDYKLRLGLQAAVRAQPTWTDGESQLSKSIWVMRPILRGNIYKPWITYWVSMELAGNPPYLLDAYFDAVPVEQFGVRIGQQYTPYGRQEQLGPQQLFFPDWAPVAEYFWPGRDKGGQVYGLLMDKRIEYYAGLFTASPLRQAANIPGNHDFQLRLVVNPLGPTNSDEFPFDAEGGPLPFRFSFSIEGYQGKIQESVENFNADNGQLITEPTGVTFKTWDIGGSVWVQGGPLIFSAETSGRRIEPQDGSPDFSEVGFFAQALCSLWRDKLAAGLQFDWLDPNTDLANDSAWEIEGALVWFIHSRDLQLKLRYAHVNQEIPATGDEGLPYTAGTTNLLTLQFNLSF